MIGWFLGPIFGGTVQYVSENIFGFTREDSYRVSFFVDSLLSIIAVGLVAWKVKETRGRKALYGMKENEYDDVKLEGWVKRSIRVLYITTLTMVSPWAS